jgi:hypothetical protein
VERTAELPVVTILRDFEVKISEDGIHFLRDEMLANHRVEN